MTAPDDLFALATAFERGEVPEEDLCVHLEPRLESVPESERRRVMNELELAVCTLPEPARRARLLQIVADASRLVAEHQARTRHSALVDSFWFSEGHGASPAELDAAERHVGRRIPAGLRTLLERKNGGVSAYAELVENERHLPVLPVLGVDPRPGAGSIMNAFDVGREFGVPDGVVPFASQGNAWMGLDYRSSPATPAVVYRDDLDQQLEHVASSFDEFLLGLVEE